MKKWVYKEDKTVLSSLLSGRRGFFIRSFALLASCPFAAAQSTVEAPKRPNPTDFQAGDFIWPKKPGQWVPYNSGAPSERDEEKRRWLYEKRIFIDRVRSDPTSSQALRQLATDLEGMEFGEFYEWYQGDRSPESVQPFGGGEVFYVGHVGIIGFDGQKPIVIEALWEKGVVITDYAKWLDDRPGAWVWHGRVAGHRVTDRARIADEARKCLKRPYDFWNFDLSDGSSFYCSKLCWLATTNALQLALDDNNNPKRAFWFSPKQMLKSRRVEKRYNPGNYTY